MRVENLSKRCRVVEKDPGIVISFEASFLIWLPPFTAQVLADVSCHVWLFGLEHHGGTVGRDRQSEVKMGREQDRKAAIAKAQIELNKQPIYLDTETTGLKDRDQIVEICLLEHDGTVVFDTLVKPTVNIPPDATRVHHITDAMVSAASAWPELWPQLEPLLAQRRIAIYNADYDLRLLEQTHRAHGLVWATPISSFCVMKLYAQFRGEWNSRAGNYRWYSLEDARWQCGLDLPNAHRARADTLLARAVLHWLAAQK